MPLRRAVCCVLLLACTGAAAQAPAGTPLQFAQRLRVAGRLDEAIAALRATLAAARGCSNWRWHLGEWSIFGLAPCVSVAYTRVDSNADTYDSRRATAGFGSTSSY